MMYAPAHVEATCVAALLADPAVTTVVDSDVYGGLNYPDGVSFPSVKFHFPNVSIITRPAVGFGTWWSHTGQMDVHGDSDEDCEAAAHEAMRALTALEGTSHDGVQIGTVSAWDVQKVEDSSWTPPRKRWIVSVTLTARRV